MHIEQTAFIANVKKKYPENFYGCKVLECGSLNINGSVRELFSNCDYTGIDVGLGLDVDIVCPAKDYFIPDSCDTVISSEMLEHDATWRESLQQMYVNLKSGGLLIITCASPLRNEHGTTEHGAADSPYTNDYYHNLSTEEIASVLTKEMFTDYYLEYGRKLQRYEAGTDTYFYGIKK